MHPLVRSGRRVLTPLRAITSHRYMPEKDSEGPITEDCPVKLTSQRQAEEKLAELGLPWTCFRKCMRRFRG